MTGVTGVAGGAVAREADGARAGARPIVAPVASPMTALDAIYARRATRAFAPEAIGAATVRALLRAAARAPAATAVEARGFVVVQDAALLGWISARVRARLAPAGRARAGQADRDPLHGAGTLVVVCGHGAGPFVEAECWLAAGNLMLAATALGLGTCPIGIAVAALAEPAVAAALALPAGCRAIAPIVVGVAAAPRSPGPPRRAPAVLAWRR